MLYIAFAKVLSGTWQKGWEKNMTLVNSEWTGTVMEKRFGITARVVYPPVVGAATPTNWDERENGFVFLGRISPEKQIEKIIHILAKVREKNPSLHLHIIGRIDDGPYERFIRELCNKHTSWCKIETSMYGQEKWEFISKHKYGISARPNEPFGIAVAEMVTAGCIVFVPEGGGQTEIVANPQMIYHNGNDAVQKIEQVLKDDKLQRELSEQLSNRAPLFSVERFQKEINDSIAYFLNNYGRSNHTS
jgi:glycosyltransferase involved in cell wall biosynthesis